MDSREQARQEREAARQAAMRERAAKGMQPQAAKPFREKARDRRRRESMEQTRAAREARS